MFSFGQSANNQQTNAFGTPTNNAFGANPQQQQPTSLFGQPQQQQGQQQGNQGSTFGGFGTASTPFGSSNTSGLGVFGAASQSNAQQGSTPSFGFGNTQQTTPAFGSSSTGLLGGQQNSAAPSAFGIPQTGGGLFGSATQSSNTGAFGGGSVFGQGMTTNQVNVPNGTVNPPFVVTSEKEGTGTGMNHFQSITCMPAYANSSFEELRVQDYAQGRRFGSGPSTGTFSSSFGQAAQPSQGLFGQSSTSTPFGQTPSTNAFGSQTNQSGGLFGASQPAQNSSNPFGQTSNNGIFGSQQAPASTGLFGNTSGNTNLFGSGSTGFGSTANQQQPQQTSIFGQQQQQPQSNSLFGNQTQATSSPFGLGNQQQSDANSQKPFSFGGGSTTGFGSQAATTTGPFGATNTTPSTGLFGQTASQQTSSPGGLFGQAPSNATSTSGTGAFNFGGNTQQATSSTPAFSFGNASNTQANSNASKPNFFGTTSAPATNTGGFGAAATSATKPLFSFGQSPAATNTQSTGTGLFGSGTGANTTSSPSLFGNNASTANGGGLFGNAQQPQQQSSGNLFGKSTGGLFGGQQSTSGTSNIFGAQANTGLAGSSGFGNGIGSSSLFGAQQSQAGLQPSISSSAYGNNPLFASVQANPTSSPGPLATPLVSNTVKKKPATLPRFNLTPRSNASSPRLLSNVKQTLSKSPIANARKSGLSLFDEDLLMNPDAFSPRSNIKRLVIDRKADDQELLSGGLDLKGIREGPPTAGESAKPLVESARTLVPTRQKDFGLTTSGEPNQLPSVSDGQSMSQANSAPSSQTVSNVGSTSQDKTSRDTVAVSQKDHDAYWTSPPTSVLMDLSKAELSKVSNFTVGRRGYGQVSFNSAVDLSSLEQVEDVAGKIIIFEPKMCTVYPDEELKPSVGKGLNVPATITLEQCFPLSKDKRQPIRDKTHPRFQQHVDRLKRMSETEFVDYLAESGTWIFKVEHF